MLPINYTSKTATHNALASSNLQLKSIELTSKILKHPFLVACKQGVVALPTLMHFLVQHGKYSAYFTRYLCALISQLKSNEDVLRLARNLAEELGFGENSSGPPHSQIYASLLARFNISMKDFPIFPETQNQIQTVFMLCRQPDGIAGLGALCLGAEAIVPPLYAAVMDGFRRHGFADDDLDFFRIHIECDDGHAETMQQILTRLTEKSRENELCAIQAGEIAINSRLQVYDAILRYDSFKQNELAHKAACIYCS